MHAAQAHRQAVGLPVPLAGAVGHRRRVLLAAPMRHWHSGLRNDSESPRRGPVTAAGRGVTVA